MNGVYNHGVVMVDMHCRIVNWVIIIASMPSNGQKAYTFDVPLAVSTCEPN